MRWSPTWATTLGDHRFDDKLAPRDAASIEKSDAERDAILARVVALDARGLGEADRVTLALLRGHARGRARDVRVQVPRVDRRLGRR